MLKRLFLALGLMGFITFVNAMEDKGLKKYSNDCFAKYNKKENSIVAWHNGTYLTVTVIKYLPTGQFDQDGTVSYGGIKDAFEPSLVTIATLKEIIAQYEKEMKK